MGFFDKLKKGLAKTRETITNKIEKLVIGYADIDDELLDELEETLIMADVGVNTTDRLMESVRKGIKKKDMRNVFRPGFTTKKRGWGLGLSLAKRIVEEYHHGRIYVKCSELGKGTTFRIELKRKI